MNSWAGNHSIDGYETSPHSVSGYTVRAVAVCGFMRAAIAGLGERVVIFHDKLVTAHPWRMTLQAGPGAVMVLVVCKRMHAP